MEAAPQPQGSDAHPERGSDAEGNPFAVIFTDLSDGVLYERLFAFVHVLELLLPHASTTGNVTFNLVAATRALHEEAVRRGLPLHRLPLLPWEEHDA